MNGIQGNLQEVHRRESWKQFSDLKSGNTIQEVAYLKR
jgi:hypothetical protein